MEQSLLRCQGDHTGMTMELKRYNKTEHKDAELLMSVKLLNNHYRVSLRLFVFDHSIEVHKVHKARSDQDDRCWAFYFDDYSTFLNNAKTVLRWLANHCGEMRTRG